MTTISLLGTGLMGQALGERLLMQDYTLTVFNRSVEKMQPLAQSGAKTAASAQQAIDASNICILFLSDFNAITTVLDTVDNDTFQNKYFIQMATIAPEQSRQLANRIERQQGHYLESPVLGSLPEARNGRLLLMTSGRLATFDSLLPVLSSMAEKPQYFGEVGQGSTVKLAMNQLIAGLTSSFSLSLALLEKENVNIEQFMGVLRDSALYAPTFDKKLQRMLEQNYANPNFPTKHLAKDIQLFIDVAQQQGLQTCALEGINELITKTLALGLSDTDYSALYAAMSKQ